jgi:hypothetical protein
MTRLDPGSAVESCGRGRWRCRGGPATFAIAGELRPGHYSLSFRCRLLDAPRSSPMRLRADEGGAGSAPLDQPLGPMPSGDQPALVRFRFHLPAPARGLRLVPLESDGEFELDRLRLRRISSAGRAASALWRLGGRFARDPRRFLADLERAAGRAQVQPDGSAVQVADGSLPSVAPLNLRADPSLAPRLNVLLPGLVMRAMSGGPNTALNLTYRLARRGVPVRYVSTDVAAEPDHEPLWRHLASLTGITERLANVEFADFSDRSRPSTIGARDVFFGTAWWTVQMIKRALPLVASKRFLYIIQDFEPALYAWGSTFALALETYSLDHRPIVCGRLLMEYLVAERIGRFADPAFRAAAAPFEPAIDRSRFRYQRRQEAGRAKRRLLFYARPNAPRNLYEIGIAALMRAVAEGAYAADRWEILSMGEPLPRIDIGCGQVIRPHPWSDYDGYAALLRSADAGLSLMLSPHTSYPPLEMAACGVPVVTNAFSVKTAERLRADSANLVPVEPTVEDVARGLLEAERRSADAEARERGSAVAVPPSWDDEFDRILPDVERMWRECASP